MPEPAVGPTRRESFNRDAEAACLGAVLLKNEIAEEVFSKAHASDFYDPRLRIVAEAITAMRTAKAQEPVDLLTLTDRLTREGKLEAAGGVELLTSLIDDTPTTAHALHYAEIVRDRALQRRLADAGHQIIGLASNPEVTVEEAVNKGQQSLFDLTKNSGAPYQSMNDVLRVTVDTLEKAHLSRAVVGFPTRFRQLDHYLGGGLHPEHLVVVGGRPGAGKTALVLSLIGNLAVRPAPEDRIPVGIFSLEMSVNELGLRLLAAESRVDSDKLKRNATTTEDMKALVDGAGRLYDTPVFLDDNAGITLYEVTAKARRMVREHGVKVIILDYLQLLNDPAAAAGKFSSREQFIASASRGLKILARDLKVCVIALTQLNREAEKRQGAENTPRLADIRESGAIEQDADQVIFIHRYAPGEAAPIENRDDIRKMVIAKNRHGRTGGFDLYFHGALARFENFDPDAGGAE